MGTRAVISFLDRNYGKEKNNILDTTQISAKLYIHYDGYVANLGLKLLKFFHIIKTLSKNKNFNDAGHLAARFVTYLSHEIKNDNRFYLDALSVYICEYPPGGISYYYDVDCTRLDPVYGTPLIIFHNLMNETDGLLTLDMLYKLDEISDLEDYAINEFEKIINMEIPDQDISMSEVISNKIINSLKIRSNQKTKG